MWAMGAKPGDVYNGHILGSDNVWYRLAEGEWPHVTAAESARTEVGRSPVVAVPASAPRSPTGRVVSSTAVRTPATAVRTPGEYWKRYRRRWLRTALITGAVTGAAVAIYQAFRVARPDGVAVIAGMLLDFMVAGISNALIWGSLVNFVVAAFRGDDAGQARIDTAPRPPVDRESSSAVCPDCGKSVDEGVRALHPRYCTGRAAQTDP
jgi:membrane glycosyltransferase